MVASFKARKDHWDDLRFILVESFKSSSGPYLIKESLLASLRYNEKLKKLSKEDALAFMIKTNLSKASYQKSRNITKINQSDLFPPYNFII